MAKTHAFQYISSLINKLVRDQEIGFKVILDGEQEFVKNRFVSWTDMAIIDGYSVVYEFINMAEPVNAEKGNKYIGIHITRLDTQRGSMLIEYDSSKSPHPSLTVSGTTDIEFMHEWYKVVKDFVPSIATAIIGIPADALKYPF